MRLLILGGGWFLGYALSELARDHGHHVTTFSRGQSGQDVPGVRHLRGDRTRADDMEELARGGPWDAVIDTSGMTPEMLQHSASALAKATDTYVYISTVNVYRGWPREPLNEASPLRTYSLEGPPGESGPDAYGRQKVGCELAVTEAFADRAALLRPGVIIGPREYVGRIPWWLARLARGGRVLAPGTPTWPIQPIDVRDVAQFAIEVAERRRTGAFNLAAPVGGSSFGDLLQACTHVTGSRADLTWVDHEFLIRRGVREWVELPLWRPYAGTWRVDAARARAAGLRCRPLAESVADTWAWLQAGGQPVDHGRAAELGITAEREAELLAAWDEQPR
ncbi:NAD-dependent epimerase/dehydratase family protein [Nonomuraea sp. NPDC050790]|uniref:NAD-dependent epimerase/dehydratase family protein n=1 Tax=Nonomuraea sp. NPDC050790 TaxID=3364371 RepID=UPI0037939225